MIAPRSTAARGSTVRVVGLALLVAGAAVRGWTQVPPAVEMPRVTEVLGRPTDDSVTVNARADQVLEVYYEYGPAPGTYAATTPTVTLAAFSPAEILIHGLEPDARTYFRMRYRSVGSAGPFAAGTEHSFHTQRAPGSGFRFCVQGDSHPERAGRQFDGALYARTLATAAADGPDFYLTIGDDFSIDTLKTIDAASVAERYTLQLPYLALVGQSAPLFLVNGNHEQAARYLLNGTPDSPAVWAQNARNLHYPQPAPDGFYTGNAEEVAHVGLLRNRFAWTWGDALFVVIDPYWSSPVPVDGPLGGGPKTADRWEITLGDEQYFWLKQTLEASTARWKFVFAHHVSGTGRGGIERAGEFEWGGLDADGTWGFTRQRPTWPLPIHQLMAANGVTIFFQGHDHIFVRQELDGVIYQSLPEPADPTYTLWNADAYTSGDKAANSGYVRVTVTAASLRVDYVKTYLPNDESTSRRNGEVAYSYSLPETALPRPPRRHLGR